MPILRYPHDIRVHFDEHSPPNYHRVCLEYTLWPRFFGELLNIRYPLPVGLPESSLRLGNKEFLELTEWDDEMMQLTGSELLRVESHLLNMVLRLRQARIWPTQAPTPKAN